MVSLDPEISNLLWVQVSSEATSSPGSPSTCSNVLKEKWKILDIQNGSKNRISNSTFFGIKTYIRRFMDVVDCQVAQAVRCFDRCFNARDGVGVGVDVGGAADMA